MGNNVSSQLLLEVPEDFKNELRELFSESGEHISEEALLEILNCVLDLVVELFNVEAEKSQLPRRKQNVKHNSRKPFWQTQWGESLLHPDVQY